MKIIKIADYGNAILHEYMGWKLEVDVDEEPDNRKNFYTALNPSSGMRVPLNWSPYNEPSYEDFSTWVHFGMPAHPTDVLKGLDPRGVYNNWDSELIRKLQEQKSSY